MNCRNVTNKMSAYVDGELTGEEMLVIRRHLSDCETCSLEHMTVRKTKLLLSKLRTAVPRDELLDNIMTRLDNTHTSGLRAFISAHFTITGANYKRVGLAAALCGLMFIAIHFSNTAPVADSPNYTGSYNLASSVYNTGQFSPLPNVPGIPYCISNDKPLRVVNDKEPFASEQFVVSSAVYSQ